MAFRRGKENDYENLGVESEASTAKEETEDRTEEKTSRIKNLKVSPYIQKKLDEEENKYERIKKTWFKLKRCPIFGLPLMISGMIMIYNSETIDFTFLSSLIWSVGVVSSLMGPFALAGLAIEKHKHEHEIIKIKIESLEETVQALREEQKHR